MTTTEHKIIIIILKIKKKMAKKYTQTNLCKQYLLRLNPELSWMQNEKRQERYCWEGIDGNGMRGNTRKKSAYNIIFSHESSQRICTKRYQEMNI